MDSGRILAVRDGATVPLFGPFLNGPLSPSPSMPIETHHLPPGDWQSHRIPEQMITLFLRPATLLHIEGNGPATRMPVQARSVAFSLRDREESICWTTETLFTSLTISDAVLARATEELSRSGRFELLPSSRVHDERLSSLLHVLHLESVGAYAAGKLFVDGVEQSLAALLVKHFNAYAPHVSSIPQVLPPGAARRVLDYMHAHLADQIGLADLARCTPYSESHFCRLFKASYGMAPHQYLLQLRVEQAKVLLCSPRRHSVLEVAILTGFTTAQHFSRMFLKMVGLTPSAYKRLQQ